MTDLRPLVVLWLEVIHLWHCSLDKVPQINRILIMVCYSDANCCVWFLVFLCLGRKRL